MMILGERAQQIYLGKVEASAQEIRDAIEDLTQSNRCRSISVSHVNLAIILHHIKKLESSNA